MDDPVFPVTWVEKLLAGATVLVAYVLKRYQHKVDLLEKAQGSFVTREELNRDLALLRADALQRHQENLVRLGQISASQVRIHERIDRAIAK